MTSHPAVLDGFIRLVRQEIKEREQVAAKETMAAVLPEAKPKHKRVGMDR